MASFKFKFESLLTLRKRAEEQKQQALAGLLRQKQVIEGELADDQQSIRGDKHQMQGALLGHVDVARIRQHAAHVHQSAVRAQQKAVALLQLSKNIDTARADLAEAVKQRKAIEKLREKQHAAWQAEQDRREAAQLDELAVQGYERQRNGGFR
jgi:flagellar FliJ protein